VAWAQEPSRIARGEKLSVCQRIGIKKGVRDPVTLLEELQALGIAFVSLAEGIDATTPEERVRR
jgi:DNA invertase Pin-like site-specific DNA recombinase